MCTHVAMTCMLGANNISDGEEKGTSIQINCHIFFLEEKERRSLRLIVIFFLSVKFEQNYLRFWNPERAFCLQIG
jgi:hypothetical protein